MVLVHTRFPETRTCDGTHEYLSSRSRRVTLQTGTRNTLERFVPDTLAPTFVPGNDIAFLLSRRDLPFFPDRLDSTRTLRCSPIFSLTVSSSFSPSLSVSPSLSLRLPSRSKERRRWRLITTQSPVLPVRAGNSDPFSESSNRLLPPWGIHHCGTATAKPTIFVLGSAGKKGLSTVHPLLRLFSPNHRRADRSADYWHPGNPSREWRRFHFENRSTDPERTY